MSLSFSKSACYHPYHCTAEGQDQCEQIFYNFKIIQISGKACPSDCNNQQDQGVCDRRTGKCNCNNGFTGDTCTGT